MCYESDTDPEVFQVAVFIAPELGKEQVSEGAELAAPKLAQEQASEGG
jgi:hypothetical protein